MNKLVVTSQPAVVLPFLVERGLIEACTACRRLTPLKSCPYCSGTGAIADVAGEVLRVEHCIDRDIIVALPPGGRFLPLAFLSRANTVHEILIEEDAGGDLLGPYPYVVIRNPGRAEAVVREHFGIGAGVLEVARRAWCGKPNPT